ncbi:Isochorismate synthase MenF [Paenibacillus plantiphilus]|uniref:aminodeoxychorismate synthase n=1 Tax=Paenibacillus plantiphilus TaxID=2905650 RepID=A0ABM9C604_9BACL|nr:aminodeoxychorismate synthase component I [Paenibacillus plantiphilus]CAH1202724.1 Isochorismate synthase MenF [Paenibacillus plantiphilus]
MKTLLIDNYDSYTFNLFQLLAEINGEEPFVIRNDALQWHEIAGCRFDNIVISPGPGNPGNSKDFGICLQAIAHADVPVLGVCLGHQGIGHVFGSQVVSAPEPMHGRLSELYHNNSGLFAGIKQGTAVVRYHSLVVEAPLSDELEVNAWTKDGLIMGLRHKLRPVWGVQFHPESIETACGRELLCNFKALTDTYLSQAQLDQSERRPLDELRQSNIVPSMKEFRERLVDATDKYEVHVKQLGYFTTPESVFTELYAGEPYSFWLDSSRTENGMARFSYMGAFGGPYSQRLSYRANTGELEIVTAWGSRTSRQESVYDYIERTIEDIRCDTDLPFDYNTGFVGYLGYEMKIESGGEHPHISELPDAAFMLADRLVVFDHLKEQIYLLSLTPVKEKEPAEQWFEEMEARLSAIAASSRMSDTSSDGSERLALAECRGSNLGTEVSEGDELIFKLHQSHDEYLQAIGRTKQLLREGETYEINLTNEISASYGGDSFALYLNVRRNNPAPYSAYMQFGDYQILCSSPERFVKIDRNGGIEAKPIKGTIRRSADPHEDERLRRSLQSSEKDRSENLMIVDLLRNDLGAVSEVGSVHVAKLMDIESYETVHQMVSTIRGKLRRGLTAVSCIRSAFPGGSMTGAPKIRSMSIIDQLEGRPRGIYSGAIGFLAVNGSADMNIVIRTLICNKGKVSIGVGGAIVMLSDAEGEYDEMLLKADVLLQSVVETTSRQINCSSYRLLGDRSVNPVSIGG